MATPWSFIVLRLSAYSVELGPRALDSCSGRPVLTARVYNDVC